MKPKLMHIAFMLVFIMLSTVAKARDPIILPEEPQAYAPFTIGFFVKSDYFYLVENNSVTVDVTDNTITMEYLGDSVWFLGPLSYFETEIQGLPAGEYKLVTYMRTLDDGARVTKQDEIVFTIHEAPPVERSEEHTSELQSRPHLVCRLLL